MSARTGCGAIPTACRAGPTIDAAIDATPDADPNDVDVDGVGDAIDNCPGQVNRSQHDEDGDGVGDVCDNCPSIANGDQRNSRESGAGALPDAVGDACDINPTQSGDVIVFFDGFGEVDPLWRPTRGEWQIAGDAVTISNASGPSQFYYAGAPVGSIVIDTDAEITTTITASTGFGTLAQWDVGGTWGVGHGCQAFDSPVAPVNATFLQLSSLTAMAVATDTDGGAYEIQPSRIVSLRHVARTAEATCALSAAGGLDLQALAGTAPGSGRVGFFSNGANVRFPYIVVSGALP